MTTLARNISQCESFGPVLIRREGELLLPIKGGLNALISRDDADLALGFKWYANSSCNRKFYVRAHKPGTDKGIVLLHRVIMNAPAGVHVDHINGDTFDNRRQNLRLCTRAENAQNSKARAGSAAGFKGVEARKSGAWRAAVCVNGVVHRLGQYPTAREAAEAYDRSAIEFYGQFAATNRSLGLLP